MTRIALVSPYTLPFLCGNSFMADRLRSGLTRSGYEVELFDSRRDTPDRAVRFAPQVLHSLNADKPHHWVKGFMDRHPVPWVITLTGTDYNSWCGKEEPPPHIRENLERARALVVFHMEALEALVNCLPEIAGKIQVIAQGITCPACPQDVLQLRKELRIAPRDSVFLMVSSIRPVKNLEAALLAFSEIERKMANVRLILIGPVLDREEASRILKLGETLSSFEYLGEKPHVEVQKFIAASDVFLNTSLNEGMPGAVLEAMASGIPVLASDITGNRSLVVTGDNGLLFPAGSVAGLVESALTLMRDESMRKQMGKAGRQRVAARYSVDREVDQYRDLYRRLLEGSAMRVDRSDTMRV
jgi:glycosyltransferase involved in cell wall biosynthesis